ncbi:Allophanate hydrolase [Thermodesulfobium narugense DSM 14796]|uniref:Allophanate hydrolase n=1 Tax=Thermodesulfobium narugense DSM 14796 TaxID=747365 RepID=M1E7F5_9BACT|nr:biotin-dependent carboxyltransferase family protein [Thermodesulfobium narugense]AEE15251.1 Allophanate hydrolase [Thermodesulfobium narugense DSM 14796]
MTAKVEVVESKFHAIIQGNPRLGYKSFGVPESGPVDPFTSVLANLLLDNDPYAPLLEITQGGFEFLVHKDTYIAISGADLNATLLRGGKSVAIPTGIPIRLLDKDKIVFNGSNKGFRCWCAFCGGINVSPILSSTSTLETSNLGGIFGRRLLKGDVFEVKNDTQPKNKILLPLLNIENKETVCLRVVKGSQYDKFSKDDVDKFFNNSYRVLSNSNRIGIRLSYADKKIKPIKGFNILSDPSPLGAVQITTDGTPIILLQDRGTVGGYPKIATVIKADLIKVAQLKPHQLVNFKLVSIEDAINEYYNVLKLMEKSVLEISVNFIINYIKLFKEYDISYFGYNFKNFNFLLRRD